MLNKVIIILLLVVQFTAADVIISERAQAFLVKKDRGGLITYQLSPNSLQEERVGNIAKTLENTGIVFPNKMDKSYRDDERSRYLAFDEDNGMVIYIDNGMEGLTDQDRTNISQLKQNANMLLSEILGEESKNYKFVYNAYEYIATMDDMKERLNFITYRYVKVMDERLVLGNENYVSITLGKNGVPGVIRMVDPKHIKAETLKKGISIKSSPKYIERRILKEIVPEQYRAVVGSDVKSITLESATESFFMIEKDDKKLIVPHFTFFTEILFENGMSFPHEVHIPVDIQFIDNVDPNDIVDL